MITLAWIVIACTLFQLLPGSALNGHPSYNWGGPHVYVNIVGSITAVALALVILL